jgi:hypothetical protein
MSKMIQVRNVPDKLHRELTRRAKAAGLTLTDYVQRLLEREVGRPPSSDVFARIASRPPVESARASAELLREERRERTGS